MILWSVLFAECRLLCVGVLGWIKDGRRVFCFFRDWFGRGDKERNIVRGRRLEKRKRVVLGFKSS